MPIQLKELLRRVPAEVEGAVRRVRDQSRAALQEALRTECRLVMRTALEAEEGRPGAQVPVELDPGYPVILEGISFPEDVEEILLLGRYRADLENAHAGASGLLRLREELAQRENVRVPMTAKSLQLRATAEWAAELLALLEKQDPLKTVLAVSEDFLGVYQYDSRPAHSDEYIPNRATIRLYWAVIGLAAQWLGCAAEDLAAVVLTHELAHAYTQLGADIDGRRWPAANFARGELALKEGLAQYYTHRVLHRLAHRYGGALKAYKTMLKYQPPAYKTHLPWTETFSPEAVRRAMLEVRRWNERGLSDFERRLQEAQRGLGAGQTS